MAKPRLAVLSNRYSSGNGRRLNHIRTVLSGFSGEVNHREIDEIADIPGILDEFARFDPDILIINGGDGTIQAVLTALMRRTVFETLPPLAIVPGGMTNMIAEDLGAFADPEDVLKRYLASLTAGGISRHRTSRPLIELRLTPESAPLYGAFFGTAAVVRGIDFVRRRIHPLGWPNWITHLIAMVVLVGGSLLRFTGIHSPMRADLAELSVDDKAHKEQYYFLIMATTLRRLLLGLKPFPGNGDGLKVTAVAFSVRAIMKGLWATIFHRLDRRIPRGMIAATAHRLSIRINCPVTLDGEIFTPDPDVPIELRVTNPVTFVRVP